MKKFIKENIEVVIEAPLIILGVFSGVAGFMQVESDFRQGILLIVLGAVILFAEKIVESIN